MKAPHHTGNRLAVAIAVALLALHAVLATGSLLQKSVTVDEFAHLPAGCAYWQTGRFWLYHHNPPLVRMLAAVPVLLAGPDIDYDRSFRETGGRNQWAFGIDFMDTNFDRYHLLFCLGRMVIVLVSVGAGVVVFAWARSLYGAWGGVLAVALWAVSPTVLAHARFVTTDLGATAAAVLTGYVFWQWLRRPTWRRALVVGGVLGVAQLTKFSCLMLYPTGLVAWLVYRTGRPARRPPLGWPADVGRLLVMAATSIFVINLGYGFEGTCTPLGRFPFLSRMFTVDRAEPLRNDDPRVVDDPWGDVVQRRRPAFERTPLGKLPVPLPYHYVLGYDEQKLEAEGIDGAGYPQYLLGTWRRHSWWYYYLVCLAVKVPIPLLMLVLAAIGSLALCAVPNVRRRDELIIVLPAAVVLLVMSFLTNINLGIRYILMAFPFMFVVAGRLAVLRAARRTAVALRGLAVVLVVGSAVCTVRAYPHYLSYFNELAGGPENGHRILADSNLDWGQDLLYLREVLDEKYPDREVGVAYFGNASPEVAGIRAGFVPAAPVPEFVENLRRHYRQRGIPEREMARVFGPKPGLYAVSVNFVLGMPHRMRLGDLTIDAAAYMYAYFQRFPVAARAGHSIWIYDLTEDMIRKVHATTPPAATSPRHDVPGPK